MVLYKYRGKDQTGALVTGSVESGSEAQAAEVLESHGLSPLGFEAQDKSSQFDDILKKLSRVPYKDIVLFFRQLSTLIGAQVRIVSSLRILSNQVTSKKFGDIIKTIAADVESGKSLSEGFQTHPELFPELFISLIRAGEASGSLDETMLYLADQVEKDYDLRSKIRGALAYPIFILVLLFVIGGLMFVFVLPQMTGVLLEAGAELPLATKIIIAVTNIVTGYWWIVLILVTAVIFSVRYFYHTEQGRYTFDNLMIKLPIVGPFLQKIYLYRFAHHIANLLSGGVSIVKSLKLISGVTGNQIYKDIFLDAANQVQTGKPLREILATHIQIPPLVVQMVSVGEETGDLPGILRKLASFYDKEVDNAIANLTTLIEPVIMVILGLAVGIMVAGILLPIYNLASAF